MLLHCKQHNNHNNEDDDNGVCRIDELDDYILSWILRRVSSWNDLIRCRSVCKNWNTVISQPGFLRHPSLKSLAFSIYVQRYEEFSLITEHPYLRSRDFSCSLGFYPFHNPYYFSSITSYMDLLILHDGRYSSGSINPSARNGDYLIFNPITKKFLEISLPELPNSNYFYRSNEPAIVGIVEGISSISVPKNHRVGFRLVTFMIEMQRYDLSPYDGHGYTYKYSMQVYTSQSCEWTAYPPEVTDFRDYCFDASVTLNHKLYFYERGKGFAVVDPFSDDVTQFRRIKWPSVDCRPFATRTVGVCQERIRVAYFDYEYNGDYTTLNVWELNEDHESSTWEKIVNSMVINWTRFEPISLANKTLHRLQMGIGSSKFDRKCRISAILFHPYDRDVVYLVNDNERVVRCNLRKRSFRVVLELDNHGSRSMDQINFVPLVNPLVSA